MTKFSPVVPKFVETDKIVLRFKAHFFEERIWERDNPLGDNILEKNMPRYLTISYYVEDMSIEMIEPKIPNAGKPTGNIDSFMVSSILIIILLVY